MKSNIITPIFAGHGSPFNLFQENDFTLSLRELGKKINNIDAVIVISAHWLTRGTYITIDQKPKMIYDYYNFPKNFYDYVYPATGNPDIAKNIVKQYSGIIFPSEQWGIDHAATIVLQHLFPKGNIPVIEMSLDYSKPPIYHYELGKKLSKLREENILFIGSGNMIHTFREISYDQFSKPFEWAKELDLLQKNALNSKNIENLINYERWELSSRGFQTNDHYLPMLYILGMMSENEKIEYIYEGFQHGSISHRSFVCK